ncbi:MAG: energy transducer TonB [Cytophagales bacterium]|nr:energy transducer TonB [Cytophagales bacterium]MCA6429608.1 energy transducer TonB [Cytophagales bacterium]
MEKVQQLPDLVLAVYLTPDVTIQSSNQNEGKLTLTEPTHGASPPLSLTSFYFEVTKQLLKDSVHKDLRDSTIITFSINIDGSVSFDELLPPNPRILDHLQKNKNEFSRWKNAIQNKIPVRQSFQFSVNLEEVEEIFFVAEESAYPHRGIADFYKFIGKSIRYPAEARRRGLEGKVFVEFIIDKDGTISEAKVVKGIGGGCDEEAIRVLLTSSPWMPGKQRGKPVKQRYTLPIIFSLSDSRY